jgi:hypothetical protein
MVAILAAGAAASPPDAPGWVHGAAATGADAIEMGETGMAAIGMAATGAVATGTAIGVIITMTMMSSSLAASAFQGGGAGVGAGAIPIMVMATATRTVTTATDTPAMAMDTVTTAPATATAMAIATGTVASTAPLPDQKYLSYSAVSPAPATIMDQSMESWGLRRAEQSGPTRLTTVTQTHADRFLPLIHHRPVARLSVG